MSNLWIVLPSCTVISISSFSSLAINGHQPLILFCLKMLTIGMSCSLRTMSRVHCFAVFAPRGNLFRSSSIAPEGEPKYLCKTWQLFTLNAYITQKMNLQNNPVSHPGSHLQRNDLHPKLADSDGQGSCTLFHPRKTLIPSLRWQFFLQPLNSQRGKWSASWSFLLLLGSGNGHLYLACLLVDL